MSIRLVPWEFQGLSVTMVETGGKLYCVLAELAQVINSTPDAIRMVRKRHHEYFDNTPELSVTDRSAIRGALKLKYLRSESLLSEDDMISVALFSRSETGRAFHRQFLDFVKANARKGTVPREQYDAVLQNMATLMIRMEQMSEELSDLRHEVAEASPFMNRAASSIGRALAAQQQTKRLRSPSQAN